MEAAPHPWPTLGVLLLRDGLVTKEVLEGILDDQRDSRQQRITGRRLGELLVDRGVVTQTQVAQLVAEQYELPFVELEEADIDLRAAGLLTEELARRFSALPISTFPDGSVLLAIADPATVIFSDELRRVLGAPPRFAVVGPDELDSAIAFVSERLEQLVEDTSTDGRVVELRTEATALSARAQDGDFGSRRAAARLWPPLGALLVREGLLTDADLETALAQQRLSASRRLGEILVERGVVTNADVARLVAEQYEIPFVELAEIEVAPEVGTLLPEGIARQYAALPVEHLPDGSLRVVVADPTNVLYSDELHLALGAPLSFAVADPSAIDSAITLVHEQRLAGDARPEVGQVAYGTATDTVTDDTVADDVAAIEEHAETHVFPDAVAAFTVAEAAEPTGDDEGAFEDEVADTADATVFTELEESDRTETVEATADTFVLDDAPESTTDEGAFEDEVADTAGATVFTELEESDQTETVEATADTFVLDDAPESTTTDEDAFGAIGTETVSEDETADEAPAPFESAEAPAAGVLDTTLERAVSLGASSIHFSPQPHGLVVRARIDGVMRELETIPSSEQDATTTRLKSMTELVTRTSTVDLGVDVLPTKQGEKVTLRVHEALATPIALTDLGMASDDEETVRKAIDQPSGTVVVCGPGTSGKTTTLYAALRELNTPERTLTTVDEAVGLVLVGVDQVEVDPRAKLGFARGLDTILSSDPDVILVGHIQDEETARAAARAAAAGRLVLSGLHAPTTAVAIQRLAEMGVEPGVLGTTLTCVVAQRLVRRVCQDCRETYYATEDELVELGRPLDDAGPRLLARGRGCTACGGTGFRGRAALFEVLAPTEDIRALVAERAPALEIQRAAVAAGMHTLREDGIRNCLEGVTTAAEVQRVLGDSSA